MTYIDVRIPYEPGKQLGYAYNRAMKTVEDWVLFLDHDVYLLNPHWYKMCQEAIDQVGHDAGMITCRTNRIGCKAQKYGGRETDDLEVLEQEAWSLWNICGSRAEEYRDHEKRLSGFFMLTHRQAWTDVQGFRNAPGKQFLGVDNDYHRKLVEHGYKIYIMPGLYVYHGYKRHWKPGSEWNG